MKPIRSGLFAIALTVTACGLASPSLTPTPPPESVGIADRLLFHCSEGPSFSSDVFEQPATAEMASFPEAKVLRAFLVTPDASGYLPLHGWWLGAADAESMVFVAQDRGGVGYVMVAFRKGAVGWLLDSYGACRLRVDLSGGLGNAAWILDPKVPAPAPGDTQFTALVTEEECASGQSAEGRIAEPRVLYEPDRILVILAVRPRPGAQTCPSNPETPYVVRLKEPIGERQLLDGTYYPPHDPTQPLP
jgi:hypothetical protein